MRDRKLVWGPSRTGGRTHAVNEDGMPLCGQRLARVELDWGVPECAKCLALVSRKEDRA